MRTRHRGAALLTIMLCMFVLLTMLKALVTVAHSRANQSRLYAQRAQAQCLAEAGAAYVRHQLAQDSTWDEGFSESLPQMRGRWSVAFGKGPRLSVNNFTGAVAADGPRGKGTVPPFTLDLVVQVEVDGLKQDVELLISRQPLLYPYALTASGKVRLDGEVRVDGAAEMGGSPRKAGLRSYQGTGPEAVRWRPGGKDGKAIISGIVSTVSGDKDAIDFGNDPSRYSAQGFERGSPPRPLPEVDILAEISQHASEAPLSIPKDNLGRIVVKGSAYLSGDLNFDGDLKLKGGTLYVNGDVDINGSISGDGSVYVAGRTKFKGDASVKTEKDKGVALYSHGSVKLTGFDGDQFLKALAKDDPAIASLYDKLDSKLDTGGQLKDREVRQLSALTVKLAAEDGVLSQLKDRIKDTPESAQRDFMVEKLNFMEDIFDDGKFAAKKVLKDNEEPVVSLVPDGLSEVQQVLSMFLGMAGSGGVSPYTQQAFGLVGMSGPDDELKEGKINNKLQKLMRAAAQISYDRVGSAYFQGAVHTNGYLYAANEIIILGAVWTDDDGSQPPGQAGGQDLRPGDIFLSDGVDLTLNEAYLMTGPMAPIRVGAWLGP